MSVRVSPGQIPEFVPTPAPAVPRVPPAPVDDALVRTTWTPLAASWLLMALELPAVSAVMARLAQPEISLAAYGGVVFPLAMLIEAPIIMMLAASTSLSRDRASHRKLARFVHAAGAALTALHVALVATPLYDVVVAGWMGAPPEILGPARTGLWIVLPWTWSIAYRRFQQGVLIRTGNSRQVGAGTVVRMAANGSVLAAGWLLGDWPGIVVGAAAVATGVVAEAAYVGVVVQRRIRELPDVDPDAPPLTRATFLRFYTPLVLTAVLNMSTNTLAAAAMTRMPRTLDSLAVWPVVGGFLFILRSMGFAFHEVVVALLGRPGAEAALSRFARRLAAATVTVLALVALTPLAQLWLSGVSALSAPLAALGASALLVAIPLPATAVFQSRLAGTLVHRHATRGVLESVTISLTVMAGVLLAGIAWGRVPGIRIVIAAALAGQVAQIAWLRVRTRQAPRLPETSPREAAA